MIHIIQGFKLSTRDPVDVRLVLSKEEMCNMDDDEMPSKYFAVCTDDSLLYAYDKETTPNEDTGKFTVYSASVIDSISINGVTLPISTSKNVDLPLATAEQYGLIMPGKGLSVANDGQLVIDFNSIEDESIPFEKINFEGAIIDASNISII